VRADLIEVRYLCTKRAADNELLGHHGHRVPAELRPLPRAEVIFQQECDPGL